MERRGIEPRTFPMLRERYTTKPHPLLVVESLKLVPYKAKDSIPIKDIAIRVVITAGLLHT